MNNEEFNDAMCRLRQAEGDFNNAYQDVYSAISKAYLKNSSTEVQAQIDEAYNKGLQDLYEAFHIIAAEDGMSVSDLNDAFGVCSVCNIILRFTPEEIIDKALEWKTRQKKEDQELRVGDEVTISGCAGFAYIILYRIYETEDLFKLIEPTSLLTYTYSAKSLTKTGKHYDSIPLPKEIK